MYAPLRVFATLVLVVSVVAPGVLSTPVGYVFSLSKLARPIDLLVLFAVLLLVIQASQLPHVKGTAAMMGRSAAWFPSLLGWSAAGMRVMQA